MKHILFVLFVATSAVPLWGCDSDSSPTSPTAVNPPSQSGPGVSTGAVSIEGRIDSVAAPDAIVISGRRIVVGANTSIRSGASALTFADLQAGQNARVAAEFDGTTTRASVIEIDGDVGRAVQMRGVITGMSRNGDEFQFRIDNEPIRGNGGTQVVDGSAPANASNLRDGQTVTVDALQRADHVYAKRVQVDLQPGATAPPSDGGTPGSGAPGSGAPGSGTPGTPGTGAGPTVNVSGLLSLVSGVCPALVLPIDGQVVVTNSSTVFVNGSCEALRAGTNVEVVGTPVAGQVVATQVTIR